MLQVLADGDDRYRLEDADGTAVGWISGRVIGLRGMPDEGRTMSAAAVAWRALDAVLRRTFAGWPRYTPAIDRLRLVHDGVDEWISDGTSSLARLVRTERTASAAASLALEFELPSFAHEGLAITAAQAMGEALRASASASVADAPVPVAPVPVVTPRATRAKTSKLAAAVLGDGLDAAPAVAPAI